MSGNSKVGHDANYIFRKWLVLKIDINPLGEFVSLCQLFEQARFLNVTSSDKQRL